MARPQQACRARAAHQKLWFFIGKHENAHRAQARAQFSKCAPRAGESSILPTPDGAHDHVSKQSEHRAEAGAPFSIKKRTARMREAQKCSSGAAKVLPLQRRAPYKSIFGPASCPQRMAGRSGMTSTCMWTRQGIALAQRHMAAHDGAFCAFRKSAGLFRANEDEGHLESAVHRFETSRF